MTQPIRVLLVEDDEDDQILAKACLEDIPTIVFEVHWVKTSDEAIPLLRKGTYDVALLDYHLGKSTGLDILSAVRGTTTPCILLTGQRDLETDIAAMEAGASDYIVKQDLAADTLGRAIRYALERTGHLRSLEETRARLAHDAHHDPLTGLANRTLFVQRAEAVLATHAATPSPATVPAVLFLDLDDFKDVNDSKGHLAGDRVLVVVADRLRQLENDDVLVSRLGGDEFAILLIQTDDPTYPQQLAQLVLDQVREPISIENSIVRIGGSIGISMVESVDTSVTDLMRNADVAMYVAKGEGSNQVRLFAEHMHQAIMERLRLESELRDAITRHEIVAYFQPIFDVITGEVASFEALARWEHPTHGTIPPNTFIGLAESTGMIVEIGLIVLDQAVKQLMKWRLSDERSELWTMSVNLSPRQIEEPDLVERITNILETHECPPHLLQLEITESLMVNQASGSLDRINAISSLGIRLAMDDFGTGYSSLSYLQDLPLSALKIDRIFVSRILQPRGAALVKAIVAMASSLGHTTIAEGVETSQQLEALRAVGCDLAQGSLRSMPIRATAINDLLLPSLPAELLQ
jgi:diguanylate cyclase (GGDEF)-like protein